MDSLLTSKAGAKLKQQALWFIQREKQAILRNHMNGAVSKDHAIGALSILYEIASGLKDTDCMKNLQQLISEIRNARFPGLLTASSADQLEWS